MDRDFVFVSLKSRIVPSPKYLTLCVWYCVANSLNALKCSHPSSPSSCLNLTSNSSPSPISPESCSPPLMNSDSTLDLCQMYWVHTASVLSCALLLFAAFFFPPILYRHMEIARLGVRSELQLPAYLTATAIQDQSCICDPHHSSWQHQILNPLSETRDRTRDAMDTSWVHFHCTTMGIPHLTS